MWFFRMPRFIRRFLRRRMNPVHELTAAEKRRKYALLYMFFAWNAGGLVLYQIYKGNTYWAKTAGLLTEEEIKLPSSVYYAKLLGIKKADVVRVSGFTVVDEHSIEVVETPDGGHIVKKIPKNPNPPSNNTENDSNHNHNDNDLTNPIFEEFSNTNTDTVS